MRDERLPFRSRTGTALQCTVTVHYCYSVLNSALFAVSRHLAHPTHQLAHPTHQGLPTFSCSVHTIPNVKHSCVYQISRQLPSASRCQLRLQAVGGPLNEWPHGGTSCSRAFTAAGTFGKVSLVDTPGSDSYTHSLVAAMAGADGILFVVSASEGARLTLSSCCKTCTPCA